MLEISYRDKEFFVGLSFPLKFVAFTDYWEVGLQILKNGGFDLYLFIWIPFYRNFRLTIGGQFSAGIKLGLREVRLHSPKDWVALAKLILTL